MTTRSLDITDKVRFGLNDAEFLPIKRCVCGKTFGHWDFFIDSDPKYPTECPECGRKMWFALTIRVYQEATPEEELRDPCSLSRPVSSNETSILVPRRPATPLSDAMDKLVRETFK